MPKKDEVSISSEPVYKNPPKKIVKIKRKPPNPKAK